MLIAKLNENEIIEIAEDRVLFSNVSFPLTGADELFLFENSCVPVIQYIEVLPNQKLEEVSPYIQDGKVYTVRVLDKSPEELQQEAEQTLQLKAIGVRNQRNELLKDSDWTQVADAPVDKTAWATYRQALRDITGQTGFPSDVTFPTQPAA